MSQNWRRHTLRWVAAGAIAGALWLGQSAMAQAVFGGIVGTVTDATGAAIPSATVTVTDVSKGTSVTITTNASGEFTVDHLIPDTYNVKVAAKGFKGFEQKAIQVFADSSNTVSAVLPVGGSDQVIEVSADAVPQLKTDRADVATNYTAQELTQLPIPDHNFANLQLLLPGAVQLGWSHAASENPQGSKQIQIDGQAFGGVNYTLDGTDNQDAILGIIVINPNSESMSEAKIATQNFDAEFGKAVASVDSVQTKSGTNEFHGTLFDNRESAANLARDPFSQPASGGVPAALKNQFGGSIGGPIIKDKAFFFGDYQGVRQKVGYSATQTVPTAHLIATCLGQVTPVVNGVATPGCDFSEYTGVGPGHMLYNTTSGTPVPFAGNVIPAAMISANAMNLFKLLQPYAPNINQSQLTNNYAGSGTGLFNSDQWDVRGDATLYQKVHVFGRFSRFTDTLTGKTMFGAAGGSGFGLGGYGGTSQGANDSLALGADMALSDKLVADVRLGYFRYNINTSKYDTGNTNLPIQGENTPGTGANAALTVATDYGAPDFNIADIAVSGNNGPNNGQGAGSQYGAGLNVDRCNCPLKEKEDQFQFVTNWTRTIRTHAVKFGVDLRYARNLRVPSDNDRTGVNQFGTGPTSAAGAAGTGLGYATFVLGDVTAFNRYVSTSTNAKEFQPRDFFYVQDTWRATPKLTINAGVRYEFYAPERVNGPGNGALLNAQTGYLNVAGVGGVPLNMGVGAAKNAWNPRLGVAYQLNQKTVIRAGYGRSFDLGVFGSTFGHVVTQNIPVLANQSINAVGGYATYAFQLDNPASTQGGLASGLSNYSPVTPNASGQISIQSIVPGTGGQTVGQFTNVKARPFTMRLPTLDAWNVAVQRSLTPTLSLTVSYVGNKGTHTLSDGDGNTTNLNEPAIFLPASYSSIYSGGSQIALHYDSVNTTAIKSYCTGNPTGCSNGVPLAGQYAGATNNTTLLRRYVGGNLPACTGACNWTQDMSYYGDDQDTHYNALQAELKKTYTHGLSINANYAYQRGRSTQSGFATWDKQAAIGPDSAIRRSAFTAYGLYKLPFGRQGDYLKDVNAFVDGLVGGWEFSPTFVWQSGLPFSLSFSGCGNDVPGDAPCLVNGSASALSTGANGTPGTPAGVYFFKQQTLGGNFTDPGLDKIGNVGRNTAFGPNFFNSDMSLMKNVTFKERYQVQLRMDAYNAFNHINYGLPNGQIDASNAGQITSGPGPGGTTNPRQLQFTLHLAF